MLEVAEEGSGNEGDMMEDCGEETVVGAHDCEALTQGFQFVLLRGSVVKIMNHYLASAINY